MCEGLALPTEADVRLRRRRFWRRWLPAKVRQVERPEVDCRLEEHLIEPSLKVPPEAFGVGVFVEPGAPVLGIGPGLGDHVAFDAIETGQEGFDALFLGESIAKHFGGAALGGVTAEDAFENLHGTGRIFPRL